AQEGLHQGSAGGWLSLCGAPRAQGGRAARHRGVRGVRGAGVPRGDDRPRCRRLPDGRTGADLRGHDHRRIHSLASEGRYQDTGALGDVLMKYLHTMVRVTDIEASLAFYCNALGLKELSRKDYPQGRYTLVFLAAPGDESAQVELTHNWDPESYTGGRNFGHLAYAVENVYATCQRLRDHGVTILRPPRDGRMAFVRSPDNISIELLQQGAALTPAEPWKSMPNTGNW